MAIKNVVLVHGNFVDGSGWQGVYDHLTADGYRVAVVQIPNLSFGGDVAATRPDRLAGWIRAKQIGDRQCARHGNRLQPGPAPSPSPSPSGAFSRRHVHLLSAASYQVLARNLLAISGHNFQLLSLDW